MTCREVLRDRRKVALDITKNSFPHSFRLFLLGVKVRISFLYQVRIIMNLMHPSFLAYVEQIYFFWSEYMVGASFYIYAGVFQLIKC